MTTLSKVIESSSVIKNVIYFTQYNALCIQFKSGSVWIYYDVSIEVYDELIHAHSAGTYFNKHIRDFYTSERFLYGSELPKEMVENG